MDGFLPNTPQVPHRVQPDDVLLAQELAREINPWEDIAQAFDIEIADIERRLATDKEFAEMVRTIRKEWAAIGSTKERIRVKSRAALELLVHQLAERGMQRGTDTGDLVNIAKQLARMGDVEPTAPGAGAQSGGSGVSITLNFGHGATPRTVNTIQHETIEHDDVIEADGGAD